jgi:hypothetical protein
VINLAGPFTTTATTVAHAAMSVGAAYIDIANERPAVQAVLDLSARAERSGILLAPASGFGTVATEGLAAWLADGEAIRGVELALLPDNEGRSPGAFETVLLGLASGGSRVVAGRHRSVLLGAGTRRLWLPDGTGVTLVPADLGDLASIPTGFGASDVTASVGLGIPPLAARCVLPAVSLAARSKRLRAMLASRASTEQDAEPHAYLSRSWARVHLRDGRIRAGWLSAGEGYRFTADSVVALARRIAQGDARPGARTAVREFGPAFLAGLPGVRLELSDGRFADAAAE